MNCKNCDTSLTGRYCTECGQDSREPPDRLVPLLGLLASHATGAEGKAIPSVWWLLTRPGHLTRAYLDGHRARYTNPVQLYLWCSAILFLLHAYSPFVRLDPTTGEVVSTLSVISLTTPLSDATLARLAESGESFRDFAPRFDNVVSAYLPVLLIGLVAVAGLLMAAQFRGATALTHATFALHWTAFYFVLETARQLVLTLGAWGARVSVLGSLLAIAYLAVAMHTVYQRSWMGSALRAFLTHLVFGLLLAAWLWSTAILAERLA